jgi:hypothetical protein
LSVAGFEFLQNRFQSHHRINTSNAFRVGFLLKKTTSWAGRKTNRGNADHQNCWNAISQYRFLTHTTNSRKANLWFVAGIVLNLRKRCDNPFVKK